MVHMSHNLATSVANMSLLLKSGDVELNPGPGRFSDLDYDSVDGSKILDEEDWNDVMAEVIMLSASYFSFGRALGLPAAELNAVKSTNSQNPKQGLNDVTLAWLRQKYDTKRYGPPTWRRLVEAVDDSAGGDNHAQAKAIASHHPAVASVPLMKSLSMPENQGSVKLRSRCHRQWVSEDDPPLKRQRRLQSTTHEAYSFDLGCDLERASMDETLESQASHGESQGLSSPQFVSLVDRPMDLVIASLPKCTASEEAIAGAEHSIEHCAIHLECDVYQVNSKRQIKCSTDKENRSTSAVHRDIKMKVIDKKFNTVPPCTPIFLRVSASKTCYIYIINIGSTGNISTLIPNDCESENHLQAGQYLQFPSQEAGYTFELDQNSGTETIIVLAYDRALSEVDQAERDCANLMKHENEEHSRDIKMVKNQQPPRGFLKVQFNVS